MGIKAPPLPGRQRKGRNLDLDEAISSETCEFLTECSGMTCSVRAHRGRFACPRRRRWEGNGLKPGSPVTGK